MIKKLGRALLGVWLWSMAAWAVGTPTPAQLKEIQTQIDLFQQAYQQYLKLRLETVPDLGDSMAKYRQWYADRDARQEALIKKMHQSADIAIVLVDMYFDLDGNEGKNYPKGEEPRFDHTLAHYGDTNNQKEIRIGPSALESVAILLHTKVHEFVHVDQLTAGIPFPTDSKGRNLLEVEAHQRELALAPQSGLSQAQVGFVTSQLEQFKSGLSETNLERAAKGLYYPEAVPLRDALQSGRVKLHLEGKGVAAGTVFKARLQRLGPNSLVVEIAAGTPLCPVQGPIQEMMVSQDVFIPLTAPEQSADIPGYCLDPELAPPPPPQPGQPPVEWTVANPCENPARYLSALSTIRAGQRLSESGGYHTDMPAPKYRDTVIQRALWHRANPKSFGKQRLHEDLTRQVADSGGRQTPEQIQQLTDHLWDDVDLTLKQGKASPP